jgi:CubicO group peptidase (beta-lactamase class C family)
MRITPGVPALIAASALCLSVFPQGAPAQISGVPAAAHGSDPLPRAKPEQVGMSTERLALIGKAINADVERGRIPGAVVAIARRGKLTYFEAFGYRDKAVGAAMTTDTIFNITCMTKPMTAVGALTLYEKGQLLIGDPIAKYFPKFANMKVAILDNSDENVVDTVPARAPIQLLDLFRHTSGLIYRWRGTTAVHKLLSRWQRGGCDDNDWPSSLTN